MAIIFDECHRSQFGENHQAIKEFFPKAQLFGFTGTPIFNENAIQKLFEHSLAPKKTTEEIFEKELHAYTISHAIDDQNVLRFRIEYYKASNPDAEYGTTHNNSRKLKEGIVRAIVEKHDSATDHRRFNALFATSSINDAIEYVAVFKDYQAKLKEAQEEYKPLNIACVFSPPSSDATNDIKQLQEDLEQEKIDNSQEPEKKKGALIEIINDYNRQYGTNYNIYDFDAYYQDIQQRIKRQKYRNADNPHKNKIDICIVVDMLLTGFDSHYLNTLYVDKNLKYHGLIQAFSRTNRVLNSTKPFGKILDFRGLEQEVEKAIILFSGEDKSRALETWIVDSSPKMIEKFEKAIASLQDFMQSKGLNFDPRELDNLRGDASRAEFLNSFREIQNLKQKLGQYTDLKEEEQARIESLLPEMTLREFRSKYIEIVQRFKEQSKHNGGLDDYDDGQESEVDNTSEPEDSDIDNITDGELGECEQDYDLALFSSVVVDLDYIMNLISNLSDAPVYEIEKRKQEIISLLCSVSNMQENRDDIISYVNSLHPGQVIKKDEIHENFLAYQADKHEKELRAIAEKFGLGQVQLKSFVDTTVDRLLVDEAALSELMASLELGWRDRTHTEQKLMQSLLPLLKKSSGNRAIEGLAAYEILV